MNRSNLFRILAVLIGLVHSSTTWAQSKPGKTPPPCQEAWSCGVSIVNQKRAETIFMDAQEKHRLGLLQAAVKAYREALEYWDHPKYHYFLTIALVLLDEPAKAYRHTRAALRYDKGPLDDNQYETALKHRSRLEGEVGFLEWNSKLRGVQVLLDGRLVLDKRLTLKMGTYVLEARHEGRITASKTLRITARNRTVAHIDLVKSETVASRRWSRWKPWALMGVGLGVAAAGGFLHWRASSDEAAFRAQFALECPSGCLQADFSPELRSMSDRATWKNRASTGFYASAGVAFATGLVLVALNRERQTPNPAAENAIRLDVTPQITGETAGLSLRGQF